MITRDKMLDAAIRHFDSAQKALDSALRMEQHGFKELAERDLSEAVTHEVAARIAERVADRILDR